MPTHSCLLTRAHKPDTVTTMSLRLTVHSDAFEAHIGAVAQATPSLVPVVKGNGYGLGRPFLIEKAAALVGTSRKVAVGTVYEARDVPATTPVQILSPIGSIDTLQIPANAIPTIATVRDLHILQDLGWSTSVVVKLASTMSRFGATTGEFPSLVQAISVAGLTINSCALHVPLSSEPLHAQSIMAEHLARWLPLIPECVAVSLSHVTPADASTIVQQFPSHTFEVRMGTHLWHGDKSFFTLQAEVLAIHSCRANDTAGYHNTTVPVDGNLVVIGAGTAHGVSPLSNGDSPFHFDNKRIALLEFPYMHNAMGFVPSTQPCPQPGDLVDVQRPLTMVSPDIVIWE